MKRYSSLFLLLISLFTPSICAHNLNSLAIRYHTDKRSGIHNYPPIYEKHFEQFRNNSLTILEIGFGEGCSAHMWQDYFPNATLYFIDINPSYISQKKKEFSSRCHFYIADQSKQKDLLEVASTANNEFDIIIDDGSHQCAHQIFSFKILFPFIKKGGCYVIEDLHTSYWHMYGGAGNIGSPKPNHDSAITFFQSLVHDLNFIGAYTGYADKERSFPQKKDLRYFQKHIDSIHFHRSMCFIYKR